MTECCRSPRENKTHRRHRRKRAFGAGAAWQLQRPAVGPGDDSGRHMRCWPGTNIEVAYAPGCWLAMHQNGANPSDSKMVGAPLARRFSWGKIRRGSHLRWWHQRATGRRGVARRQHLRRLQGRRPHPHRTARRGRTALLEALQATGKPVVFVNCSGSAMAMPWAEKICRRSFRRGIRANKADAPWAKCYSVKRIPPAVCRSPFTVRPPTAGV